MDRSNNRVRRPQQDSKNFLERATESFQEDVTKAATMAAVGYTLIGAIILFGLIGYGIDRWRGGSSHVFLIVGLLLGVVVGFVDLAKFVWKR